MKKLTIGDVTHGPYTTIEVLDDRYQCDGIDLPFSVLGEGGEIGEWEGPLPTNPVSRDEAKAVRAIAVDAIKVTTAAGNTFDGDEVSQNRMTRAIIALSTGLAQTVTWVLSDNSTIDATAEELTEALVLAGMAQAAIWVIPE